MKKEKDGIQRGHILTPGGGGVLSPGKGTDCGPTAEERWLSRLATRDG